jgi:hypothetical protein
MQLTITTISMIKHIIQTMNFEQLIIDVGE